MCEPTPTGQSSHVQECRALGRGRGAELAWDAVTVTAGGEAAEGSPSHGEGWAPPSSVFLNDSEAAQCVWLGFSLALSDRVGGGKKKERKEKDQISVPLNCPGFVQPTVIVRLSL